MRDPELDHANMADRREKMLDAAYRLFTENSITSVTLEESAQEAGCGKRTLLRYYDSKPQLVIAVSTWKWTKVIEEYRERRGNENYDEMTAREMLLFYLDSFLEIYRRNKDMLRFNQLFNVYIQSENVDTRFLLPYQRMIENLVHEFHILYEKAKQDNTVRTDIPEEEMFSTSLHLMLAVVTRYAVGLIYHPEKGFDAEKELTLQKEMLMSHFCSFKDISGKLRQSH